MDENLRPGLKSAWDAFRRLQARALCAFLYYAVLTPYAAVARLCGAEYLDLSRRESYWKPRAPRDPAVTARRLY